MEFNSGFKGLKATQFYVMTVFVLNTILRKLTREVTVHVRSFLIQALGLRQCHFYSPAALPSGKESHVIATYLIQDWMKPRANLHVEGKTRVPLFAGCRRHVVWTADSHFTERAVRVTKRFM
jgi:hypothetical protein